MDIADRIWASHQQKSHSTCDHNEKHEGDPIDTNVLIEKGNGNYMKIDKMAKRYIEQKVD